MLSNWPNHERVPPFTEICDEQPATQCDDGSGARKSTDQARTIIGHSHGLTTGLLLLNMAIFRKSIGIQRTVRTTLAVGLTFVVILLASIPISEATVRLDEQLMDAARRGNSALVKDLIGRKADPNARDQTDWTPLMHASRAGDLDTVKILLKSGANLDSNSSHHGPALSEAVSRGHLEVAQLLVGRGANVNASNGDGVTPLMKAVCAYGEFGGETYLRIIMFLITQGAAVNARTNDGQTALIWAAGGKNAGQIVRLLLDRGASIRARNSSGRTALIAAVWNGNDSDADVIKLLLERGADVNAKDIRGKTVLMYALGGYLAGRLEPVKVLLEASADVNAKTADGKTALMEAAAGDHQIDRRNLYEVLCDKIYYLLWGKRWGPSFPPGVRTPEAVTLLLEKGAEVNARDRRDWTALDWARHSLAPGASAIVQVLKAHGGR
jgi:ankyrin repeat protein